MEGIRRNFCFLVFLLGVVNPCEAANELVKAGACFGFCAVTGGIGEYFRRAELKTIEELGELRLALENHKGAEVIELTVDGKKVSFSYSQLVQRICDRELLLKRQLWAKIILFSASIVGGVTTFYYGIKGLVTLCGECGKKQDDPKKEEEVESQVPPEGGKIPGKRESTDAKGDVKKTVQEIFLHVHDGGTKESEAKPSGNGGHTRTDSSVIGPEGELLSKKRGLSTLGKRERLANTEKGEFGGEDGKSNGDELIRGIFGLATGNAKNLLDRFTAEVRNGERDTSRPENGHARVDSNEVLKQEIIELIEGSVKGSKSGESDGREPVGNHTRSETDDLVFSDDDKSDTEYDDF